MCMNYTPNESSLVLHPVLDTNKRNASCTPTCACVEIHVCARSRIHWVLHPIFMRARKKGQIRARWCAWGIRVNRLHNSIRIKTLHGWFGAWVFKTIPYHESLTLLGGIHINTDISHRPTPPPTPSISPSSPPPPPTASESSTPGFLWVFVLDVIPSCSARNTITIRSIFPFIFTFCRLLFIRGNQGENKHPATVPLKLNPSTHPPHPPPRITSRKTKTRSFLENTKWKSIRQNTQQNYEVGIAISNSTNMNTTELLDNNVIYGKYPVLFSTTPDAIVDVIASPHDYQRSDLIRQAIIGTN